MCFKEIKVNKINNKLKIKKKTIRPIVTLSAGEHVNHLSNVAMNATSAASSTKIVTNNHTELNNSTSHHHQTDSTNRIAIVGQHHNQSPSSLSVIKPDNFLSADHSLVAVYCFVKNFIG